MRNSRRCLNPAAAFSCHRALSFAGFPSPSFVCSNLWGESERGNRYSEVVQRDKRLRIYSPETGGKDVFVHISAVERAGLRI
jgi:hypothetical protein